MATIINMNPQVITFIQHTTDKEYDRYTAIINGKEEGLSWYGSFLSPENQPEDTLYLLKLETRRDYGSFGQWYIDTIIGRLNMVLASNDMYEALKEADKLIKLARQYFPKSMHNPDKFQLENTCAAIGKALSKAEGR
jgi:hypothetical protein